MKSQGIGMDDFMDYLDSLPRLDMVGYCPIAYRDMVRASDRRLTDQEIDEAFDEYARGYRDFERRLAWH